MANSDAVRYEINKIDNDIDDLIANTYDIINYLNGTTTSIDSTLNVNITSGNLVSADDYLKSIADNGIVKTENGTYDVGKHELTYIDEYGKERKCKMHYYLPEGVTDPSTLNVFTLLGTRDDVYSRQKGAILTGAGGQYGNIKETQCLVCVIERQGGSSTPATFSNEINAGTRFANSFAKSNPETKNIIGGGSIGGMSAVKIAAESVQNGECLYDVIVSANYPGVRTDGKVGATNCAKTSYYKGDTLVRAQQDNDAYLTQEDVDRLISTNTQIVCISSESCGNVNDYLTSKSVPAYNGFAKMVENAKSRGIEYKCSVRFIGTESTVNKVQSKVSADAKELIEFDSNYETYGINDKSLIKGPHNYYARIEADVMSNTSTMIAALF